jgi:hypothetical protein
VHYFKNKKEVLFFADSRNRFMPVLLLPPFFGGDKEGGCVITLIETQISKKR